MGRPQQPGFLAGPAGEEDVAFQGQAAGGLFGGHPLRDLEDPGRTRGIVIGAEVDFSFFGIGGSGIATAFAAEVIDVRADQHGGLWVGGGIVGARSQRGSEHGYYIAAGPHFLSDINGSGKR